MMPLLITQADLSDYTRLSPNLDALLITPALRDAHTFDVGPQLSAAEATDLATFVALPPDDQALPAKAAVRALYREAVRPLLCYHAYRRYLLDAGVHLTPTGPEVLSDIGRAPLTTAQRQEMRADAEAKCSHYQAVLAIQLRTYRGAAAAACGTAPTRRPRTGGLTMTAI